MGYNQIQASVRFLCEVTLCFKLSSSTALGELEELEELGGSLGTWVTWKT